jgi:hypothetical protein
MSKAWIPLYGHRHRSPIDKIDDKLIGGDSDCLCLRQAEFSFGRIHAMSSGAAADAVL